MYYDFRLVYRENKFLQEYLTYSPVERAVCFLTLDLNQVLDYLSFNSQVRVVLAEHDANRLKYYWFDRSIKSYEINLSNAPEDREKMEQIISLQFNILKAENVFAEQWTQIGTTNYLMEINNKEIFIVAVADWKDYLSSKLWKHVIDVFAENWSWTLETNERKDILEIPSPSDAIENGDFYWATTSVACCRVMNEGGFDTGYGDPYESTVFYELVSDMAASCYEKRDSKGIIVPLSDAETIQGQFRNAGCLK